MRHQKEHIILTCSDCGKNHRRYYTAKRCFPCVSEREKKRTLAYVNRYSKLRKKASYEVFKAIKSGELPRLSLNNKIKCVDCGEPATVYDHRDYAKPLDVVPVCKKCNATRGSGENSFKTPDNMTPSGRIRAENKHKFNLAMKRVDRKELK